jgi:hypothetical protein
MTPAACVWISLEFEVTHARDLLGQTHQAWVDLVLPADWRRNFSDRAAQGRVSLRR